jgi:hypothetical protein
MSEPWLIDAIAAAARDHGCGEGGCLQIVGGRRWVVFGAAQWLVVDRDLATGQRRASYLVDFHRRAVVAVRPGRRGFVPLWLAVQRMCRPYWWGVASLAWLLYRASSLAAAACEVAAERARRWSKAGQE